MALAFTQLCPAEEASNGAMTTLLRSIAIKDLKYEGAPLSKVLSDLQEVAKASLSPDSKMTINLTYKLPESKTNSPPPTVDLNLKNTSIYEALTMLGMLNGLEVKITPKGALLSQTDGASPGSW